MTHVTIIAEPGCTAEGDLNTTLDLVEMAAGSGCDVFKGQWTSSAGRMVDRRRAAKYYSPYRWLETPVDHHETVAAACRDVDLQYACSIYLPEDAAVIAPHVSAIKIASFEAQSQSLLIAAIETGVPLWISTGMLNDVEVSMLAAWLDGQGASFTLFHCTSAYPTPVEDLNLAVLRDPLYDGFSDHSPPRQTGVGGLAVTAGARLLETHVRLDECDPKNPDYAVARSPDMLTTYVERARYAVRCLGSGEKTVRAVESEMALYKVME